MIAIASGTSEVNVLARLVAAAQTISVVVLVLTVLGLIVIAFGIHRYMKANTFGMSALQPDSESGWEDFVAKVRTAAPAEDFSHPDSGH